MLVRNLVKQDFETIGPYEGTYLAKPVISKEGAIVVMENGAYIGVLTPTDLLLKSHSLIIDCLSSKPSLTISHTIEEAMELMKRFNTSILPVYDDEVFTGIVQYSDIIEHLCQKIEDQKNLIQGITHDLKNPFLNISSFLTLLKAGLTKEETEEASGCIEIACNYAIDIIKELQQPAPCEENERSLELTGIGALLKECIKGVKPMADTKEIEIVNKLSQEEYYFPIQSTKFKRAINNLLSNAIKFTAPKGQITVSSSHDNRTMVIEIDDTGVGIPLAMQPFIFTKFTKAKRAGTAGEQSTGLGLFITKQIIEQHNGHLWFESSNGTGSAFYIKLEKEQAAVNSQPAAKNGNGSLPLALSAMKH